MGLEAGGRGLLVPRGRLEGAPRPEGGGPRLLPRRRGADRGDRELEAGVGARPAPGSGPAPPPGEGGGAPAKAGAGGGRDLEPDRVGAAFVVLAFAVSRALFVVAGGRFDARPLVDFYQLLDADLLRSRLAESLAFLHVQPPLFNLYAGLVLKAAPGYETALFQGLQLGAGLALSLLLYGFLRSLGSTTATGALLTALLAASPPSLLYEAWLFYELPVGLLLLLAAVLLARYLRGGRFLDGLLFFGVAAGVTWTRSLFHVAWLVLVAILLALGSRRPRAVLEAAAAPIAATLGLCAKNALLFGFFGTSSWLGMSLAKGTTFALPREEREALISSGELSPFARVTTRPAFPDVRDLPPFEAAAPTGVPALDRVRRLGGATNYNQLSWVRVSREYLRDAKVVLRRDPSVWLFSVGEALTLYFRPSCEDGVLLPGNRRAVAAWEALYDRVVLADFGLSWTLLVVHAAALAWGGWFLLARGVRATDPERGLVLFAWLTVAWVAAVGNLLEVGENNRFRWAVDPLAVGLVVHAVSRRSTIMRRSAVLRGPGGAPSRPADPRDPRAASPVG